MKPCISDWVAKSFLLIIVLVIVNYSPASVVANERVTELNEIKREINAYVPDPDYADDPFIMVTIMEAIMGREHSNGGIGACLVYEATGEIVERGHNRQFDPYFRSDLHAEMDVLDRYEERMRFTRVRNPHDLTFSIPRNKQGLVLYTSVEPCPMCLTRIINAGVKKVYYATDDEEGGMAHRFKDLPPFWQELAQGMVIAPARCSPYLKSLAQKLFHPMQHMPGGYSTGG